MEERTIELTVISASDLKKVVSFGKQSCYAVAYIYPQKKVQTKKDSQSGTEPAWNEKITLACDERQLLGGNLVIVVEIYSDGTFSDKLIGSVTIPVSDIAKDAIPKESKDGDEKEGKEKEKEKELQPQYLAFEVRRPSGKAKGVLNVALKFGEKRTIHMYQPPPPPPGAYAYDERNGQSSQVAYPAPGYAGHPPLATGYPNQYPPPAYGPPAPGYQYPPQQMPYYQQQPPPYYPQQPPPYYAQQPPPRSSGRSGLGLGLGAGLLGGALGGLLIADAVDDIGDDCGDF